ncbi:hypothetical protein Salat_1910300 [Sesamum alatum]|uniref:Uncharacterized protein n=1 Tax=Sesamum alatum TaxID=300844 RepID=A0AAE2CIE1_9LAMI|nr:hypothetical protein Salat_1910300 [Sesamum alatum]
MLVDADCEGQQLDSLVGGSCCGGDYFLRAAFDEQGAISIIKLIRKVKWSPDHAFAMTSVLSIRFMDIMTHPTARDVILECLLLFPTQPNQFGKVTLIFEAALRKTKERGYNSYYNALVRRLESLIESTWSVAGSNCRRKECVDYFGR